jgi:O-antigen/teichoic acid export membrane protein
MKTTLFGSGVIYVVSNVATASVPFFLLPILTRALTPEQYGQVVAFYMLVAILSAVAGLGLHAAVGVRWLDASSGNPRSYTASAILLVAVSTLCTAVLAATLVPHFGVGLTGGSSAFAAIVAGATVLQNMRFAVWQSCERPRPAGALQVLSALLNIGLSLVAVLLLQLGGFGRIAGATVAGALVAVACVYSLRREQEVDRPSLTDVKQLLRFGLPLIPHTLAGSLLANADRFAVSTQLGTGALGIYGAASQLGMAMNVIADAAVKAYTPLMYGLLRRKCLRSKLRLVAITYLSIPVWLLVALAIWGLFAIAGSFVLGARYMEALHLSIWFLVGGAVLGVYLNIAGLFFFTGKTEWISAATVAASIVALLVSAPSVARFGVVGGAAAYLIAQVALLVAAWGWSCRVNPLPWGSPILAVRVLLRPRSTVAA